MPEVTVRLVIDEISKAAGIRYLPMIKTLETKLTSLVGHRQSPWHTENEMLTNVFQMAATFELFPEGIDPHLTGEIEKLGVSNFGSTHYPTPGEDIKGGLAYLIYSATATKHVFDIAQTLETRYKINVPEDRYALADKIMHTVRWDYQGDLERFYGELDRTPVQADLADRIRMVERKPPKNSGPAPRI